MINNVFSKEEVKGRKTDVDISNDSREIAINQRDPGVSDSVWVVTRAHERFPFTAQHTRNLVDFRPWRFLD